MSFITGITARITDWPKEGETAQAVRDDAVKRGVLPPEQSPHLPKEEIPSSNPDNGEPAR